MLPFPADPSDTNNPLRKREGWLNYATLLKPPWIGATEHVGVTAPVEITHKLPGQGRKIGDADQAVAIERYYSSHAI
jgi:hypothetical protein